MYQPSPGSLDLIQRLRNLGAGNDPLALAPDLLNLPAPKLRTNQFFSPIPGLPGGPGGIIDPTGDIAALGSQPTQQDYVEEYLKSMAANLGGNGTGLNQADYEEALKNSAAQIKGAFGAEIGAVKASSANARHQTKRSKKQIKAMYNALNREYQKSAGAEVAQGKDIANAIQGVATSSAGQLKGTSDQLLNEQAALAKGLGVEAALPAATAKQVSDTASQVGNIQQYGAREAGDQLANSGSQQRYLVRGGNNALLEGTNRRADLVQQLQAFLQQNMGKIADIKGQRGQALAANSASVAKSFGDANNQASNESWNRQKDLASLLLSLRGQNTSDAANQAKSQSYAQQQSTDNLMKLMQLLSTTASQSKDPKKMAEVYKLLEGALQAQAAGG